MYKLLSFDGNFASFTIDIEEKPIYEKFAKTLPRDVEVKFIENTDGSMRDKRLEMTITSSSGLDIYLLQKGMNFLYERRR